jgi:hypothetical protein
LPSITLAKTKSKPWSASNSDPMDLKNLVQEIPDFVSWNHVRRIKLFAWFLHSKRDKERFDSGDIRRAYDTLFLDKPANLTQLIEQLGQKIPKEVLKDKRGYYLAGAVRDALSTKYGGRPAAIYVDRILRDLPSRIPNLTERTYLDEALKCFNGASFRAAVIMAWNLAFDHLCEFVLAKHLTDFNSQLLKSYPKADVSSVNKRDDFNELKEFQVLMVCKSAGIITDSLFKVMKEKLERRNIAAHPSGIQTTQPTAEHFIIDLVENVVVKLA